MYFALALLLLSRNIENESSTLNKFYKTDTHKIFQFYYSCNILINITYIYILIFVISIIEFLKSKNYENLIKYLLERIHTKNFSIVNKLVG